jgi:O-antigen ligase
MITAHPMLGVGLNNFVVVMPQYLTPDFDGTWLYVVHNKYLLVWAETGVGGLLAFLAFLLTTLRRGWRCWTAGHPVLSPLALGCTAAIAGDMVHMFVDVYGSRAALQQLVLLSALVAAMCAIARQARTDTGG